MNLENVLNGLEAEMTALKNAYEVTATQLPVFTTTMEYSTLENKCKEQQTGEYEYTYEFDGAERVVVTFNTALGANTLATLEVESDDVVALEIRRVPYVGGARWIVTDTNNMDSSGNWKTTKYRFAVQSAVEGTMEVKMIWQ